MLPAGPSVGMPRVSLGRAWAVAVPGFRRLVGGVVAHVPDGAGPVLEGEGDPAGFVPSCRLSAVPAWRARGVGSCCRVRSGRPPHV